METSYSLEFNVNQQCFHFASKFDKPDTYGWFTITNSCTEKEFIVFECFLKRAKKENYSKEYILQSFSELNIFWNELLKNNIVIN